MTKLKMSKACYQTAVFLMSGAVVSGCLTQAFAQTAGNNAQTNPGLLGSSIRGTIDQSVADTDPLVFDENQQAADDAIFGDSDLNNTDDDTDGNVDSNDPNAQPGPLVLTTPTQQAAAPVTPAGQVVVDPTNPNGSPRDNIAVSPTQSGTGQNIEVSPFAPAGFRLGSFNATATFEETIGYSTNFTQDVDGEETGFLQSDASLVITSDFSRHQLQSIFTGNYRSPFIEDEADQFIFTNVTSLRLDLADGHTLTAQGNYAAVTQNSASDDTVAVGTIENPLQQIITGSLELERAARKLQFTLRGSVQRELFEDADLGGGVIQDEGDRFNNLYELTTRVGYEVSPALIPFVEGVYGVREFDEQFDRNGNQRDSDRFELRGGVQIDLGEKLNGEISAGYLREVFEDPLIEDLTGFSAEGMLVWSPERETNITFTLATDIDDSIALNDNGSVNYNGRIDYDRQISSRWALNGFADLDVDTDEDQDLALTLGAGLEYFLNRSAVLTANVQYLSFTSNDEDSDFTETEVTLGLRLQK